MYTLAVSSGFNLSSVPDKFKDYELCKLAVTTNRDSLEAVPICIIDKDICLRAVN